MFQSHIHIQKRKGLKGTSRFQYLQDLVNEFQETQNIGKKKIHIYIFNFHYNYYYLLNINLFIKRTNNK